MWKARAVQWQNAGINIKTIAPKEGVISYVSGLRDSEERAEQGGRLRVPRRRARAVGAGGLSPSTWVYNPSSTTRRSHRT
jgi:hypothetical protein